MNAPRFLISTIFQGRKQTRTWDSSEPVMLGRSAQGPLWVLERTMKGEVRIRSLAAEEGELANAHSQVLGEDQMERGVQVRFKKKEGLEIAVEIKALNRIHPSIYRKADPNADLTSGFSVYSHVGDWNTEHSSHKSDYVGKLHDKDLFHVMVKGNTANFRPIKSGLILEINGVPQKLDSIVELNIRAEDFFKTTVKFGLATWYFGPLSEQRRDKIFEIPLKGNEADEFRRISAAAAGFVMLFLGINAILPEKKLVEEPIPPQLVQVIVQKTQRKAKPKVAQQKKLDIPNPVNPEPDKKPLAMSEKPDPVPPAPDKIIVLKGGSGQKQTKTAGAPKVVVKVPVRSKNHAKVQNLFAGVMRGGLQKIIDSKSLEGVTRLGSGVNVNKGDMRNLGSAMANLNVDVNAGGGGDSKVQGFGGDSNAGAKGKSTIGYANGTKGVISGTGGSNISLGTGDADVEEGLTKEEVGRVIHAHIKEIKYCYDSSMIRTERVDGKVILDFTINGSGRVSKVVDRKPATLPDPGMTECIMRRLKTWQFPNPKGGVNVDVSYPFIFRTLGGN